MKTVTNDSIKTLTGSVTVAVGLAFSTVLIAADKSTAPDRPAAASAASPDVVDAVRNLVGACKGVWTAPVGDVLPARGCDLASKAHGPLLGNGRVGVQLSGTSEQQRFHIAKNDFWTHNSAKVLDCPRALTVGGVTLEFPELKDASCRQEQQIYPACVVGAFGKGDHSLATRSWLCRGTNLLVVELRNEGKTDLNVQASQWAGDPRPAIPAAGVFVTLAHWRNYEGSTTDQFCGLIRDVRLFSACLTAGEVAAVRDGASNAPPAAQAWPLAKEKEQASPASLSVPAMTAVPFTVAVWLNPETDDSVRVARKRKQFCQHTTRAEADVQCVIGQNGNIHGDYNLSLVDRRPHLKMFHWQALADQELPKGQWSHVAATFDGQTIRIYINGKEVPAKTVDKVERGEDAGALWFTRHADIHHPAGKGRVVTAITRIVGAEAKNVEGHLGFKLVPGQTATVVTAILGDRDAANPIEAGRTLLAGLDAARLAALRGEHEAWWKAFWEKSFVDVKDATVQEKYYGSLYITACGCSEDPNEVPPGMVGNLTMTDEPAWANDMHMNYNYQGAWWGLYSANRIEITASYDGPILDYMEKGRENVRNMGVPGKLQDFLYVEEAAAAGFKANRGVFYPVGIGPWGLAPGPVFWGQKINAAHGAVNMMMRYYSTYDLDYARRVYPFLLEVANFWEDYLRHENGRYVVYYDNVREQPLQLWNANRPTVPHRNNLFALALVPKVLQAAIDMSTELGVDKARHKKWKHIIENMSRYPVMLWDDNKIVFRLEEEGLDIFPGWQCRRFHNVWPSGGIGLDSPKELLEIARNTADMPKQNGFWPPITGLPPLPRIGYNPERTLNLVRNIGCRTNYLVDGLVENNAAAPATLNEMLMQSHEGVIRCFPVWEKERPAQFHRLRAYGAFLVSGEFANGAVRTARIESEKGRPCRVQNPWPGQTLRILDATTGAEIPHSADPKRPDYLTFNTEQGRAYNLTSKTR
jgi:hypothetical protein